MGNRLSPAGRRGRLPALGAALVFSALLVSCPNPIDVVLLQVAEDSIAPALGVASPKPNDPYYDTVTISGTLLDSSLKAGDNKGAVKTITFTVADKTSLSWILEFTPAGSYAAVAGTPAGFQYEKAGGGFSFTVSTKGLVGTQTMTLTAVDRNGNKTERSFNLQDPGAGPWLWDLSPTSYSLFKLTLSLSGKVGNSPPDPAQLSTPVPTSNVKQLSWSVVGTSMTNTIDVRTTPLIGGQYQSGTFVFDPAQGTFGDTIDLSAQKGDIVLDVLAVDFSDRPRHVQIPLKKITDGPMLTFVPLPPNNPSAVAAKNPTLFSHLATASITIEGTVDGSNFDLVAQPKPVTCVVEQNTGGALTGPCTLSLVSGATYTFSFTFTMEGPPPLLSNLKVTVTALDKAGLTSSSSFWIYDKIMPGNFTITPPPSPTVDTQPTWNWSVSAGTDYYTVALDGTPQPNQTGTSFTPSTNLSHGDHTLSVMAADSTGNLSLGVGSTPVHVENPAAPAAFVITPPATPTTARQPSWTWTASAGTDTYEIALDGAAQPTQTGTSFTPSSPLGHGNHTLVVTAKNQMAAATIGTGSTPVHVEFPVTPGAFTITSPTSPTINSQPTWTWTASAGGDTYAVSLDGVAQPVQAGTSFTPSSPLSHGSHTLSVTAWNTMNASLPGTGSTAIHVENPATPGAFAITPPGSPTINAQPTWSWAASAGMDYYSITLDSVAQPDQAGTTFTPSSQLGHGNHTLVVTAKNDYGNSTTGTGSTAVHVESPATPGAFAITPPASPTISTLPTWSWAASAGADSYDITLDGVSQGSQTGTSFTVSSALTHGNHTLVVTARNTMGASTAGTGSTPVHVENPATPGEFAVNPPATPTTSTQPTWTWTASVGMDYYAITLDSVAQPNQTGTSFTPPSALGHGSHTLQVTATNNVGNARVGAGSTAVHVENPAIPGAFALTPPTSPTINTQPTWSWTASSGTDYYAIALDGVTQPSQTGTSFTPPSPLSHGNHILTVTAWNTMFASSTGTGSTAVHVENPATPGAFAVTPPATPTVDPQPTWTWTASTAMDYYVFTLNGIMQPSQTAASFSPSTPLSHGTHTWSVTAYNNYGNTAAGGSGAIHVENPATPGAFVITPPASPTINTQPTWNWAASAGADSYDITLDGASQGSLTGTSFTPPSALSHGNHTVAVTARNLMSASTPGTGSTPVHVENPATPGAFTVTPPASPTINTQPTWNWTASTGMDYYSITLDSVTQPDQTATSYTPSSPLGHGNHTLAVTAKNNFGNSRVGTGSTPVHVENPATPEAFSVTPPASPTIIAQPTWTWTASSGMDYYVFTLDSVAQPNQTAASFTPSSALGHGDHTWAVTAYNNLGNSTSGGSGSVHVENPATPGSFTVTPPTSPTINTQPTWNWTASTGRDYYVFTLDSVAQGSQTGTSFSPSSPLGHGDHTWAVTAYNNYGNSTSGGSGSVHVEDPATPGAFTVTPPATPTIIAQPEWMWPASNGMDYYVFTLDGASQGNQTSTSFTPSSPLGHGNHTWSVIAKNNYGNSISGGSGTIHVENPSPPGSFAISAPTNPPDPPGTKKPTWNWTASPGADFYDCVLTKDGTTTVETVTVNAPATSYIPANNLNAGTYTLAVTARNTIPATTAGTGTGSWTY